MVARKRTKKKATRRPATARLAHISKDLRSLARQMSRLRPDPDNARLHDERNIETIRASLAEHGQQKPIVLQPDGKTVAAGSGTLLAARLLGWKWIAAIRYDRDPGAVAAYAVTDNRSAELATWDAAALLRLFKHYDDMENGRDLVPGWTEAEIQLLLPGMKETTEDDAPGPPAAPVSVSGEIYELGPHRLLCGDSTAPEAVSALLGGIVPILMVTDPPYGVDYDPKWRDEAAKKGLIGFGASRLGEVPNDDLVDWTAAWVLFDGDVCYVWHAGTRAHEVAGHLMAQAFEIRAQIIWRKQSFAIGRGHYNHQHEPCWYGVRKGKTAHWCGDHSQSTIWDVTSIGLAHKRGEKEDVATYHGTQKPVEVMARPMRNHGKPGDVVYDPFVGSGTTIIAAEQTERICYAVEIDPGYCDVTRQRYANFVGDPAYSPTGKIDKPSADGVK